jgi:hypothetical protein
MGHAGGFAAHAAATPIHSSFPASYRSGFAAQTHSSFPASFRSGFAAQTHSSFPASFRSGFAAQTHSSFPASFRSGFAAPTHLGSSRYTPNQRFPQRATGAGYANRRPGYDRDSRDRDFRDRDFRDRDFRDRQPYIPNYGLGFPYGGYSVGWLPDFLGYPDSSFDDNSDDAAAPQQPQESYPPDQYQPPPVDQPDPTAALAYRPSYQRPQQTATDPEPDPPVTLVFKDGRPNEQIQNYMLTRTTVYVQGPRLRLIPVDQLNLAAMNKINSDAGVEFKLPGSTQ